MIESGFEIASLPGDGIHELKSLLATSAFKPLRYLSRRPGASVDAYWLHAIQELLRSGARGFLALEDGEPAGLIVYSGNPWETEVLGTNAAAINHFVLAQPVRAKARIAAHLLDHALREAASSGVRFVLAKAHTDDISVIHALESRGFLLMDTVVDCYYDYRHRPLTNVAAPGVSQDVVLRKAVPEDRPGLMSVAREAFQGHFGRFHADERIGRELATKVYEAWMESSMDGYADLVNVAEISGRIAGFSIWRRPSRLDNDLGVRVGHYSISGIHPDFHGRGLFTALTYEGMQFMNGLADVVEGPTHINNYGVQAGYSKLHWHVGSDARHTFHKWIE